MCVGAGESSSRSDQVKIGVAEISLDVLLAKQFWPPLLHGPFEGSSRRDQPSRRASHFLAPGERGCPLFVLGVPFHPPSTSAPFGVTIPWLRRLRS